MDVNDDLRISNLADIDFGPFTGTGGTVSSPACVYRNSGAPSTNYEITAVGDGLGGGAFAITGLGGATIPYTVNYQDLVANTAIPLTSGTPAGPTGATTVNDNCGGGAANNARIDVTITTAAAAAAPADSYQGLLTLTVAPR